MSNEAADPTPTRTTRTPTPTMSSPPLTDLPSDMLRAVCNVVPARDLARLCCTCRAARDIICAEDFLLERAGAVGLSTARLEVIALHELLVSKITFPETYSVGFEYGSKLLDDELGSESNVRNSRGHIAAVAAILQMHPTARVVIDTHVGRAAPSEIAVPYSIDRGAMIAAVLVWQHNVAVSRLRVRGWGKRLTKQARKSKHPHGDIARAGYGWGEIFVECHGVTLPEQPDYYSGKPPCEIAGASLSAHVSKAAAILRAASSGRHGGPAPLPRPVGLIDPEPGSGESDDDGSGEEGGQESDDDEGDTDDSEDGESDAESYDMSDEESGDESGDDGME